MPQAGRSNMVGPVSALVDRFVVLLKDELQGDRDVVRCGLLTSYATGDHRWLGGSERASEAIMGESCSGYHQGERNLDKVAAGAAAVGVAVLHLRRVAAMVGAGGGGAMESGNVQEVRYVLWDRGPDCRPPSYGVRPARV
jgi:hypothetical protein